MRLAFSYLEPRIGPPKVLSKIISIVEHSLILQTLVSWCCFCKHSIWIHPREFSRGPWDCLLCSQLFSRYLWRTFESSLTQPRLSDKWPQVLHDLEEVLVVWYQPTHSSAWTGSIGSVSFLQTASCDGILLSDTDWWVQLQFILCMLAARFLQTPRPLCAQEALLTAQNIFVEGGWRCSLPRRDDALSARWNFLNSVFSFAHRESHRRRLPRLIAWRFRGR